MRQKEMCRFVVPVAAMLVMIGMAQPAHAADDVITGFMTWEAQGKTSPTDATSATFMGEMKGRVYVETAYGPIPSGTMECAATIQIGLKDALQRGQGKCTITARDGAKIHADITCKGVYMIGCDGTMTLTGGDGRFTGISGTGPVAVRSDYRAILQVGPPPAHEAGTGILYFKNLHYRIPQG